MASRFDAIEIGSGIGGGGIGALLAHAGWKVLVLERNKLIGGRCISYDRSGCTMDLGWHFYCLGKVGPLQEICNRTGMLDSTPWNDLNGTSYIQIGKVSSDHRQRGPQDDGARTRRTRPAITASARKSRRLARSSCSRSCVR